MGFAGIAADGERADLIAYLNTLSDNPVAAAEGGRSTARPKPAATCAGARPRHAWPFVVRACAGSQCTGTFRRIRRPPRAA